MFVQSLVTVVRVPLILKDIPSSGSRAITTSPSIPCTLITRSSLLLSFAAIFPRFTESDALLHVGVPACRDFAVVDFEKRDPFGPLPDYLRVIAVDDRERVSEHQRPAAAALTFFVYLRIAPALRRIALKVERLNFLQPMLYTALDPKLDRPNAA